MTLQRPSAAASPSRRQVLGSATAAAAAVLAPSAYAGGSDVIRLGLIGCGGRGTGAADNALTAEPGTRLVAMGDAFADRLDLSLKQLSKLEVSDRVNVDEDHRFVGFDAYKRVIDSDVHAVLLATPPHFRPTHFRAAIEAGKHVFAEKPVAVDGPGVRSVLETGELAARRGLTVVSGLGWRYEPTVRETIERIHSNALGQIHTLQTMRMAGRLWVNPRKPGMTDMEYQMRNWYYFTWLSGDFIVEQFVHELDKMAWVMQDVPPSGCVSIGGRQARTDAMYGHIYDMFGCVFDYADGAKLFAFTRQQGNTSMVGGDFAVGSEGRANVTQATITGKNPWSVRRPMANVYVLEHQAMLQAIRENRPVNNTRYMAQSTLMAIMARMSAYTGQQLTWEQALISQEDLSPPAYDWATPLPDPPVAVPGVTKFA
jgi:myo-inositol 2-dehydrogenase / D-chiro-inositol 1-dehydrogenase